MEKLTTKDLVTTGIYSAIFFIINMAMMMLTGIAPILWLAMAPVLGLLCGVIYMMLITKVQKFGPVLIMGMIVAVIYFATGGFTWMILATFAVCGLVAELIRYAFGYQSFKGNLAAYCVFALGVIGSPLPLWVMGESFTNGILDSGMDPGYVEGMQALISEWSLAAVIIATVVAALIGGLIARNVLKKQMKKGKVC
ncbi:MptD family putative ECF transporter S component [Methanomassiliicoccus luminyensis]|uniref:MptD family putative ECF transporter S component n=1 Tax=Methanomassiliicoccus luminyensis TaxID=1080712 RepID=UPI00047457EA|nr:MptD family putative ECF transporter S component [Methanomassiliicoccus luminyensis]